MVTSLFKKKKAAPTSEITGLPATSLGGTRYINGLDSAKEEYTTWDLFVVHVMRVMLNFTIFTYMRLLDIHSLIVNTGELMQIVSFDLKVRFASHKKDPTARYFQSIIGETIFYWETFWYIPSIIWKVFNPRTGTPVGLAKCMEYIPRTNTPKTVALILQLNPPMLVPPPEIPQPYLDADRRIKIPEKKEVQYVIAIRNEYFTQCKTHIAAERVRLLREMGRFITWCCLVPTITEITIFEKLGACWDGDSNFIDSIKNAILVELVALANTFDPSELKEFKKILPQIVLLDKYSKISYVVNDGEAELQNAGPDVTVDDILSSYEDQNRLLVNLCDHRVRTINYPNLVSKIVTQDLPPSDSAFNEEFSPSADLVVAPADNGHYISKCSGYACVDPDLDTKVKSVVYFSHIKFGYPFFSRALYHFALEFPFRLGGNPGDEDFLNDPVAQPRDHSTADTAPPSEEMLNVFKRISGSPLRTPSGISTRITRIPSPRSMIAKSLG
ncbi:hypothetical protein Cantr_04146 [Candida viswanathii]|uniref:Uncharacterized protein n=1 Tax=Candida viswanathii TaxID=5486 RepID=A0A367XRI8_9ASCO|nr:hypothetical protein Cantr_04146 [Candida viswanathii]